MSAKTVTDNEGAAREAVLRAMQEAAESAAGKRGVPKGPQGTKGIVILPNDTSGGSLLMTCICGGKPLPDDGPQRFELESTLGKFR